MQLKVLIVGCGQDGSILKSICKHNETDCYIISKGKIYHQDNFLSNIGFNSDEIANFIIKNHIDIVFYTSALQIGNSIKDFAEDAKNSFNNKVSFNKDWKDFNKIMTNNNIARKECLLLPINAALDALNNYEF